MSDKDRLLMFQLVLKNKTLLLLLPLKVKLRFVNKASLVSTSNPALSCSEYEVGLKSHLKVLTQ